MLWISILLRIKKIEIYKEFFFICLREPQTDIGVVFESLRLQSNIKNAISLRESFCKLHQSCFVSHGCFVTSVKVVFVSHGCFVTSAKVVLFPTVVLKPPSKLFWFPTAVLELPPKLFCFPRLF